MNKGKVFGWTVIAAFWLAVVWMAAPALEGAPVPTPIAQVAVDVGVAPDCPYGYYDYPPYNCAPYGYYGPEWFTGGVFIGAGPWFHGDAHFLGHVDNRFDPSHGYKGALPQRGERPEPSHAVDKNPHFRGNESRDGRGHAK